MEIFDVIIEKIDKIISITQEAQSPYMDVPLAAEYLKISVSKLRKLISEGKAPFNRIDGKIVFHKRKLDLWVLSDTQKVIFNRSDKSKLEVLE
ncbi:helix-turn-helix domain-containing protein [Methanococcoides sp. SA1]|nr:helix-turn-helix domain-containing protein [Methanococcoides sp. SA1]